MMHASDAYKKSCNNYSCPKICDDWITPKVKAATDNGRFSFITKVPDNIKIDVLIAALQGMSYTVRILDDNQIFVSWWKAQE